ncbi:hypothetical protein V498_05296 [Pseudogymnoascus sp. VKM F-4517 (FW-2822)]|nr:hypothetical protein V498_05296 [Pseudogymnoascus sp. VKM F-4517 (FW-2822)]
MAGRKVAVDFDKIIQTDRTRRKNEALADDIFNRGRRQSAPGAAAFRKPGTGPSLASRVGISKDRSRSITPKPIGSAKFSKKPVPAGNVNSDWTHDLHGVNNPSPLAPSSFYNKSLKPGRNAQFRTLLSNSVSSPNLNAQFNVLPKAATGLSIRGIAGPTTVQAQNFAPGTTAADIESAMTPIGGKILKCTVVATRPNVIAEIVFENRDGANCIIDTFHNQTADGRVLNLFIKPEVVSAPKAAALVPGAPTGPAIPVGPRADRSNARPARPADSDRYNQRNRDSSRNDVVDGSYGFEDDRMDTDQYDSPKPLYSDNMVGGRSDRGDYRDAGRGFNRAGGRGGARGRGYR